MINMYKHFRLVSFALFFVSISNANNVQIGPGSLIGTDTLSFTISWENSWRVTSNPNNWDAVWVFVKRTDCANIQWHHDNLSAQDAEHSASSLLFVDAYPDKKGVMIYRAAPGAGNVSNITIKLKLDAPPPGNYQYKVLGIEMVYVPEGDFYAGDGLSFATLRTASTLNPYHILSESAIPLSTNGADLWSGVFVNNGTIVPAAFPKGYNGFYCMKYEISQGQYTDFLNTIAQDAAVNRYFAGYFNQNRYTISGTWPSFSATAPDRACNWIGFKDLAAYLDWAALSLMTELEFEKAARGGSRIPLAGEMAWGGITVTDADSIVTGTDGTPGEVIGTPISSGTGLANFGNDSILGPLRCGFAAKPATTRFESGASYYGIMELSGNVNEMCYSLYNSSFGIGLNFTGTHGDGELSTTPSPGYANQGWPTETGFSDAFEYSSVIVKGGSWISVNGVNGSELSISDRFNYVLSVIAPLDPNTARNNSLGGRGVSRRQ